MESFAFPQFCRLRERYARSDCSLAMACFLFFCRALIQAFVLHGMLRMLRKCEAFASAIHSDLRAAQKNAWFITE